MCGEHRFPFNGMYLGTSLDWCMSRRLKSKVSFTIKFNKKGLNRDLWTNAGIFHVKMSHLAISKINIEHFLVSTKEIPSAERGVERQRISESILNVETTLRLDLRSAMARIKTPANHLLPQQLTPSAKMAWETKKIGD